MASEQRRSTSNDRSRSRLLQLAWWMVVLAPLLLTVPGCAGCTADDPATAAKKKKDKEAEEKKKKSEKPKDPFEAAQLIIEPGEAKATANINNVKPGHWVTASQAFKSNDADVVGEFYSSAVDQQGRPMEMDHAPFRMLLTRGAPLPKGQVKHFEFLYYVPRRFETQNASTRLQNRLVARGGGRELFRPGDEPVARMPASQYHFVVLASDPDRYGYFKRLESINPISDELNDRAPVQYYRVSLPKVDKRVPLPRHPLAWTSIAYVFWDEIDPGLLTPEQQDGMVDWLHWGGQLIISGPESLDTLRASFLGDHLPVEKVKSIELTKEAFQPLNDFWSLKDKKGNTRTLDVVDGKPPVGIEMQLREGGTYLPHCGELVAERRVGRGRVVVTGFSLTSRTVVNWGSLDNFFNGALLRRPHRQYRMEADSLVPEVGWVDSRFQRNDPRIVTTLRYFSRDIGFPSGGASSVNQTTDIPNAASQSESERPPTSVVHPEKNDWHFDGYGYDRDSGVAGWNDFYAASNAARESLVDAAGISIPKAGFVLRVIAIYLLVLVPANYFFFRVLGRVELAWVAAPVIAVVGAMAVVRLAQLDIGFARSQSEIAILEMHGGHSRAHATRYTAMYSSLSTAYDLNFSDGTALAQPLPKRPRQPSLYDTSAPPTCYLERADNIRLSGFTVTSNTTDFVHSEQMLNLGGALKLVGDQQKGWAINNQTPFTIRDVAVFRCVGPNDCVAAYVGELQPKTLGHLHWAPVDRKDPRPEEWTKSPVMSKPAPGATDVSLYRLVELATRQLRLDPGDMRLVGWLDETLPGLEVSPRASQVTSRTLVLTHLAEAPLPEPTSDLNMRLSVTDEDDQDKNDLNLGEPAPPDPLQANE